MMMSEHKHPKKRLMTPEGYAYHVSFMEDMGMWHVTMPWCPGFFGKTIGSARAKLDNWLMEKN